MEFHQMKGDIGVIGLAVMGQNLILNMNDNGFKGDHQVFQKWSGVLAGP